MKSTSQLLKIKSARLINSNTNLIALYQIFGGLFGVGLFVYLLSISYHRQAIPTLFLLAIYLFAIGTFCFSIYAGIQIFKNLKSGLIYSWINQVVQIFFFSISGYGFQYVSGVFVSIGIDLSDSLLFTFNLGTSKWQIIFNQDPTKVNIEINLVALVLILFIDKQLKKIKNRDLDVQLSSIGEV